jgi:hypothetical protein
MYWYTSVFGDEWRLIADVINYHPFTRGGLREPEEIKAFFFAYNDLKGFVYAGKQPIEPFRYFEQPLLLNQRPPSLMSSVHQ